MQVFDGCFAAKELDARVTSGQKTGTPRRRATAGSLPAVQHCERRQVFVLGTKSVTDPRTHARPPRARRTGMTEVTRCRMIGSFVMHGMDERQIINASRNVRQYAADPRATLAITLELERRWHHFVRAVENRRRRL